VGDKFFFAKSPRKVAALIDSFFKVDNERISERCFRKENGLESPLGNSLSLIQSRATATSSVGRDFVQRRESSKRPSLSRRRMWTMRK